MHRLIAPLVLGFLFLPGPIQAKKKPAAPAAPDPAEVLDVSGIRDRLIVVTDGKGHYVAATLELLERDDPWRGRFFYSPDGKTFWDQRVIGFGSNGKGNYDLTFWEPRVFEGWKRSFGVRDGKFEMQCDDRLTPMTRLPDGEARAMLDAATFLKPRWKHRAYALARDDRGNYYYVDRPREPEDSKAFRLYRGEKGALRPLKMTNVVSDSEGDIFSTRSGQLRLLFPAQKPDNRDAREPVWVRGKAKTRLTWVPLDMSGKLIYMELGVYAGQPLGTPCDDL
jgi:hypothetical protein